MQFVYWSKAKPVVINESTVISEMLLIQIVYKSKAKPVVISKSLSLTVIKKLLYSFSLHIFLVLNEYHNPKICYFTCNKLPSYNIIYCKTEISLLNTFYFLLLIWFPYHDILSSPRKLRRYHTRPLRLNWSPENVHFWDLNMNVRISRRNLFMFWVFHYGTSKRPKKRQKMTKTIFTLLWNPI